MRINNLSFPHPVAGVSDDIECAFSFIPEVALTEELTVIDTEYSLNDPSLLELVKKKSVAFCTEVFCTDTIYRKSFISTERKQHIEITADNLSGKVWVNTYLVATSEIKQYQNPNANLDYKGYSFNIKKGNILGYGGTTSFIALKDWSEMKAVSSFMEIQKGEITEGPAEFYFSPSKIIVYVSKKDYDQYAFYKNTPGLGPVLHAGIVFPALVFGLHEIANNREQYENYSWAKHLTALLEDDTELKNIHLDSTNILKIAQIILSNPFSRSLAGIEELRSTVNKEEN